MDCALLLGSVDDLLQCVLLRIAAVQGDDNVTDLERLEEENNRIAPAFCLDRPSSRGF